MKFGTSEIVFSPKGRFINKSRQTVNSSFPGFKNGVLDIEYIFFWYIDIYFSMFRWSIDEVKSSEKVKGKRM